RCGSGTLCRENVCAAGKSFPGQLYHYAPGRRNDGQNFSQAGGWRLTPWQRATIPLAARAPGAAAACSAAACGAARSSLRMAVATGCSRHTVGVAMEATAAATACRAPTEAATAVLAVGCHTGAATGCNRPT